MEKKKLLVSILLLFFAQLATANLPVVDFSWYPSALVAGQDANFLATIVNDGNFPVYLQWQFPDGNTNYYSYHKDQNVSLQEDFSDGLAQGWTTDPNVYIQNQRMISTKSNPQNDAYYPFFYPYNDDKNWDFSVRQLTRSGATGRIHFMCTDTTTNNCYSVVFSSATMQITIQAENTILTTLGSFSYDTNYDVKITYRDGNASVYLNNVYSGSAYNATIRDLNWFILANYTPSGGDANAVWDDINIVSFKGNQIDKNVNNKDFNSTSTVCLTGTNNFGSTTTCKEVSLSPWTEEPVITVFDLNKTNGFGITDQNAHLILNCDSNAPQVNYQVTWNGTIVLDQNLLPQQRYLPVTIVNGKNTGTFTCTASNSFSDSETKAFNSYYVEFQLVQEKTGVPLVTYADFNRLRITAYDFNKFFDFNSASGNKVIFSSLTNDTLRLDINYLNSLSTSKEFNLKILVPDANVKICVAQPYEQLYQQVFTSSSNTDGVILRQTFTDCYALADYTKYTQSSLYAAITTTIEGPYYLQFYDGNTKVMLTNIDGASAGAYNLQTLSLNQTKYSVDLVLDTLTVSPKVNVYTGVYDENVVQIFYYSPRGINESVTFRIYLGSTLLWSYTETNSPNRLLFDWDYSAYGLSDSNTMKIIVEKTSTLGDVNSKTYYFTLGGQVFSGTLDATVAAMIAILLIIFGLTFVSNQLAFGWFGMIVLLGGIFILALAPAFWWVTLLQFVFFIIIVWIALQNNNIPGVS